MTHPTIQPTLTDLSEHYTPQARAEAEAELFDLLRIASVSADPAHMADMRRAAEYLQAKLSALGFMARVDDTPGHPLVYAEHLKAPGKPTVLIYGHYDVQPEAPIDKWQTPPFEPTVRDGRVYARGATDDKGQAYAHIRAIELLLSQDELPLNVKFLLEGEEEVGSPNLEGYIRQHQAALGADAVIIATEWDEYRNQDWNAALSGMRQRLVIDTRNIMTERPDGAVLEQIGKRQPVQAEAQVPEVQFADGVVAPIDSAKPFLGSAGTIL